MAMNKNNKDTLKKKKKKKKKVHGNLNINLSKSDFMSNNETRSNKLFGKTTNYISILVHSIKESTKKQGNNKYTCSSQRNTLNSDSTKQIS